MCPCMSCFALFCWFAFFLFAFLMLGCCHARLVALGMFFALLPTPPPHEPSHRSPLPLASTNTLYCVHVDICSAALCAFVCSVCVRVSLSVWLSDSLCTSTGSFRGEEGESKVARMNYILFVCVVLLVSLLVYLREAGGACLT